MHALPNSAVFDDPVASVRRGAAFIGESDRAVFASIFEPRGTAQAAVVICPGICNDGSRNYRRENLLAERLAQRGVLAARIEPRGTGNSGPDDFTSTFESMLDDVRGVSAELRRRADGGPIAYVGTRLGAMVVAAACEGSPLVLWEPIAEPNRFFVEAFRAVLMSDVAKGERTGRKSGDLEAAIERDGRADVLGFPIDRALYESLRSRTLTQGLEKAVPPTMLVQFSRRPKLRAHHEALVQELQRRGATVETLIWQADESWWFSEAVPQLPDSELEDRDLLVPTADWILRELAVGI